MSRTGTAPPRRQRGIATLALVATLFFIVSLVAAYTNRNLIFEQRTSGNQYRSSQAFEAADAGAEWALSLLNAGRIDASCLPSTDVTATSFRERYLQIDTDSGLVTPLGTLAADGSSDRVAGCIFDGSDWNCACPDTGTPDLSAVTLNGPGPFPAFWVRFVRTTLTATKPGITQLLVNGCTRLDSSCLAHPAQAIAGDARMTVRAMIALRSGLPTPPLAAIVARDSIDITGGGEVQAYNNDAASGGIAVLAGGTVSGVHTESAPGAPTGSGLAASDSELGRLEALNTSPTSTEAGDRLFANVYGAMARTYHDQPGAVVLDCSTECSGDDVRNAVALNPGRVLWIDGDVDLDGAAIGSAAAPVMIVVDGQATLGAELFGAMHVRALDWAAAGGGVLHGALIVENRMTGDASTTFSVAFDTDILRRLRWASGSFVLIPGGWRDF